MNYQEQFCREFQGEENGLWFVNGNQHSKILIKVPSNLIKSIIKGCSIDFLFGIDCRSFKKFLHTGIRINDDAVHFAFSVGTHRNIEEYTSLRKILLQTRTDILLYNELGICVATSEVVLDQGGKEILLSILKDFENFHIGEFSNEASSSLDCFVHSIDQSQECNAEYKMEVLTIKASSLPWHTIKNYFIGENETVDTKIDDEEGATFEKQVWFSLLNLFKGNLFKNPIIKYESKDREFTDILAFHELGIFLIETKALSILHISKEQSMDRKVANVKGHIRKGIGQIVGATKNLKKGTDIFSSDGNLISFERNIVPHCIILISELLPFNDWDDLVIEIMKTMVEEGIYLHVMDFREFMNIVKYSSGNKNYFDYYLMQRAEKFVEAKSLFITLKVVDKKFE